MIDVKREGFLAGEAGEARSANPYARGWERQTLEPNSAASFWDCGWILGRFTLTMRRRNNSVSVVAVDSPPAPPQ